MKIVGGILVLLVIAMTGCVSSNRQSEFSVLKPWTWRTDAQSNLADNQDKLTQSERELVKAAQVEHVKTVTALGAAPISQPVSLARRTADNTDSMLAQAAGPVTVGDATTARELATSLMSEDPAARDKAEAQQARIEADYAKLADANALLQAANQKLTGELSAAYLKERADADFKHKVYWIAGGLLVLWIGGNVLSFAARINPAFSGVAAVANGVINPMLAHGYSRAQNGLKRVGEAMQDARERVPELAARMEELLDNQLDTDHKTVAKHGARNL
jgi:hypothetical protein